VERLLTASQVEIAVTDPRLPAARHCLTTYFEEIAARFENGFDPALGVSASDADLTMPAGMLLVATLHGDPVGCGALKFGPDGTAHIKRMWVDQNVRGLGLGRRLLADLEAQAASHDATVVRLDTNKTLTEAIAMYRAAGYREVDRFNEETYAHHWFEKLL
jgi:ribosomal protein S18 acetylase RimI-like enzyme